MKAGGRGACTRHQSAPPDSGDPGFGVGSPSLSDEFIGGAIGIRGHSGPSEAGACTLNSFLRWTASATDLSATRAHS